MATIDPTKVGKYPVILSDELLGKPSKGIYTGVRYNHRPTLSTDAAPSYARLKPTVSGKKGNFDLSFRDDGGTFAFQGTRSTSDEGQFVLIFDPARQALVLHRVDSVFNMNLVRTPGNSDAESLKEQYPHLAGSISVSTSTVAAAAAKPKAGKEAKTAKKGESASKAAAGTLSMPAKSAKPAAASSSKPKSKKKAGSEDESDSDDDDLDFTVEFPGGSAPSRDFSPAFAPVRRFSEWEKHAEEEEDEEEAGEEDADADGEEEDEDADMIEHFKLPSPMNAQRTQQQPAYTQPAPEPEPMVVALGFDDDDDSDDEPRFQNVDIASTGGKGEEMDIDDLEAELEAELEGEQGGGRAEDESDVSEED